MWIRGRGGSSQIQQWMSDSEVKLLDAEHSHGPVSVSPWWSYVKQQLLSFKQNSFMFSPTRESIKIFVVCFFYSFWIWVIFRISFSVKYVGNKYSCCSSGDSRNPSEKKNWHLPRHCHSSWLEISDVRGGHHLPPQPADWACSHCHSVIWCSSPALGGPFLPQIQSTPLST